MLKAVLDTNVIVAGFINTKGIPGEIVRKAILGQFKPVVDNRIIDEYFAVLNRPKFHFNKTEIEIFRHNLYMNAEFIKDCKPIKNPKLPADDIVFLEVAINSKAEYLVTGNIYHFNFSEFELCGILSPAEFIKVISR